MTVYWNWLEKSLFVTIVMSDAVGMDSARGCEEEVDESECIARSATTRGNGQTRMSVHCEDNAILNANITSLRLFFA